MNGKRRNYKQKYITVYLKVNLDDEIHTWLKVVISLDKL